MTTSHNGSAPQPKRPPTLPPHADLQQLKRQARELLRDWRAGNPTSLARAAPYQRNAATAPARLSQAQLVIARELGFPSWPALHRARASVALMLSLAWPVALPGDWQASALNQAAFNGDVALVRLLLAHGASWREGNGFGGNVMGSLLHACVHLPQAGADYLGTLQQLLAAGAPWPDDEERDALPEQMQAWLDEAEPQSPPAV